MREKMIRENMEIKNEEKDKRKKNRKRNQRLQIIEGGQQQSEPHSLPPRPVPPDSIPKINGRGREFTRKKDRKKS